MSICPICDHTASNPVARSPYQQCTGCHLFYNPAPPEFRYESSQQQGSGKDLLDNWARMINKDLATRLKQRHSPSSVLDIGSKYPFFLKCFSDLGVPTLLGIDGCDEVIAGGQELSVPTVRADFLDHDFQGQTFDLITLVHCIEHFPDPKLAMAKVVSLLAPKGVLYIRTPEIYQQNIRKHLTDEHYQIHPVLFSKKAMAKLAEQFNLQIIDIWEQPGDGQCDWQFVRKEEIKVSVAVIACSESEVIGRMLDSLQTLPSEVILYLNNVTDNTREIAEAWSTRTHIPLVVMEGYWDQDFARAKNEAVLRATGSHVCWMDCDDVLAPDAPDKILQQIKDKPEAVQSWLLVYGSQTFYHLRLWPNKANPYKPHFHDRCHEFVELGFYNGSRLEREDIHVHHLPKPKDALGRNLSILLKSKEEGPRLCPHCPRNQDETGRTLFYLGNSYRESDNKEQALDCYLEYLRDNHGWYDEQMWVKMYVAQIYTALKDDQQALDFYCEALAHNSNWAEPYMAIARLKFNQELYSQAIAWAMHAASLTKPSTLMWLNEPEYTDAPWRLVSWSYEMVNDIPNALKFALVADRWLQGKDVPWNDRIARLGGPKVALCMRPGALGDVLMTTAALKGLKEQGYQVHYVCHPSSAPVLQNNPHIDRLFTSPNTSWAEMESFARSEGSTPTRVIRFEYPMAEGYPDTPLRQHLAYYFCEQAGVTPTLDLCYEQTVGEVTTGAQNAKQAFFPGRGLVIHTHTGWSPYKNWGQEQWEQLVRLAQDHGLRTVQIGNEKDPTIQGAHFVLTSSIRDAISTVGQSAVFVGLDSVFNHASQALKKRSVILWGSTHPQGSGYPQNINIVNGNRWYPNGPSQALSCQPCYREYNDISVHTKPACPNMQNNAPQCQRNNSVQAVWDAVKEILNEVKP